jgi:hypothetical protein
LIVLPLNLKLGLEFFYEQVQVSDLDAQFLDVRSGWSWPHCRSSRGRCFKLRKRRLPWRERRGERARPR